MGFRKKKTWKHDDNETWEVNERMRALLLDAARTGRRYIRKARRCIYRVKYNRQRISDEFSEKYLQSKWRFKEPGCYAEVPLRVEKSVDLSLIIPLYNSEKFIQALYGMLVNQKTQYTYEIIFVDDGSGDHTSQILEAMQKPVHVDVKVIHKKNGGISSARNRGILEACGRYVGFIDHDDCIDENYVEELMYCAYMENADIVKCAFKTIRNGKNISNKQTKHGIICGGMKEALFRYPSFIWGGVYRRELFCHVRFPDGYWFEDMIVRTLLFLQSQKFVNIGKPLYYKVSHSQNASAVVWSDKNYKAIEQLYLIRHLADVAKRLGIREDAYFYRCVLLEMKGVMVARILNLDEYTRKQVFLGAYELLSSLYREEYRYLLSREDRLWHDVIFSKNFALWQHMEV